MAELNRLSVEALHSEEDWLGNVGVKYRDEVSMIEVHRGARLMVTDNLNKAEGIVNGAFGVVVSLSRDCLVLKLDSGVEAPIHKVSYETKDSSRFVAFPVLLGYATTLAKIQGHTVTSGLAVWPDLGVPAGGYVAVTRVRAPEQLFWLTRPDPNFFQPV